MTFSCFYWVCSRFSWRNWMTFLKMCFVPTSIKNSFLFSGKQLSCFYKKKFLFFFEKCFSSFDRKTPPFLKLQQKKWHQQNFKINFYKHCFDEMSLVVMEKIPDCKWIFLVFWSWLICFFLHIVNVFHGSFYHCKSELAKFFSLVDSQ